MDDQQKTALESAPAPDEEELKNEELDEVSGGTNAGGTTDPRTGPHR